MTVFTIKLKLREQDDQVAIKMPHLKEILASGDRELLWKQFLDWKDAPLSIHDKQWLETIINWIPGSQGPRGFVPEGLPLTEQAKWTDLARRVRRVSSEAEASLRVYGWEAEMIWKRVTDPRFMMQKFSLSLLEFLVEFGQETGNTFKDVPAQVAEEAIE